MAFYIYEGREVFFTIYLTWKFGEFRYIFTVIIWEVPGGRGLDYFLSKQARCFGYLMMEKNKTPTRV